MSNHTSHSVLQTILCLVSALMAVSNPQVVSAQGPVALQLLREEPADEFEAPFLNLLTYSDVISPRPFSRIQIRLKDDSPGDGILGAALFQEEIIITAADGLQFSNRRPMGDNPILPYHPSLVGGFRREGFLSADGDETIVILYDVEGPDYRAAFGPVPESIIRLEFILLLANDYRIDVLLDDVFVATVGSPGNVKDFSNQVFVRFGILLQGIVSAVLEGDQVPVRFSLDQNYPNPFNPETSIRFDLSRADEIDLAIYNLTGQKVATLAHGLREAGTHTLRWDGRDDDEQELASGVYLYRLEAGERVETRKLLLLR